MHDAIEAVRSGERDRARFLFQAIVRQEPNHFQAWLWLSELAGALEEQTAALEQAEALCPKGANGQRDLQVHLNALRSAVPLKTQAPAQPPPVRNVSPVWNSQALDDLRG